MAGKSFKQGYACIECIPEGYYGRMKRTPLYRRINQKYTFSGYIECPHHGIKKGVPLREIK